jgi:hypothetical protein
MGLWPQVRSGRLPSGATNRPAQYSEKPMNSKPLILTACICSAAWFAPVFAQSGGGGSAGGGAGGGGSSGAGAGAGASSGSSATGTTGTSAATAGSDGATSAAGSRSAATGPVSTGTPSTPAAATPGDAAVSVGTNGSATAQSATRPNTGGPNTSSSMPSRSVLNTATPPSTVAPARADGNVLPPGLSTGSAQPGISPLSGLPVADIPTVSRGTPPLGAEVNPVASGSAATDVETRSRIRAAAQPNVADPAAVAAHPETNPLIGTGMTMVVQTPPPPSLPEATPPASTNDAGEMWIAGHYSYVNGQWTWVDGMWQRPPHPNGTWIPGSYDALSKRWTEGHWSTVPRATKR